MQPLNDGPRALVPESTVRELLQSHRTIQILYGADALDEAFNEVADISGYMIEGSKITSQFNAAIHRVCSFLIDSDVLAETGWSYLSGFLRPYMTIRDPQSGEEARFNLGVYTLTTPSLDLGRTPSTLQFNGYDLIYLLRQPLADSYEVPAGTDPAQAAAEVIGLAVPDADVFVEDSGEVTPARMSWPFDADNPVTYYAIVQTLLAAIGYMPVWVDWEGRFRIEPFADLQEATPEWTFDLTESDNIVAEERKQDVDLYEIPNWWRFVVADLEVSPVEGVTMFTWEDSSASNPGSTQNRSRLVRHIEAVPAASFEALKQYAQRKIAATLAPAEEFTVKTQPFPLAWHMDLIEYIDPALDAALPIGLPGRRKVVATEWTLPLDGLSDMDWTWQNVGEQTSGSAITETIE